MRVDEATGPPGPLRAAPALAGRARYEGYDVRGAPPGVHRGLPSPYLTLIVTFGGVPVTVAGADGVTRTRATVLGGLHTEPISVVHAGRQSGIHVSLHPLAARALLGAPAAALAGLDLDAADVLGALGRELAERVDGSPGWAGRVAALDDVLSRRLAHDTPPPRDEVRHAWSALLAGSRVGEVARAVGWSERHLTQQVRSEIGTTPKTLGRLARFHRARGRVLQRAAAGVTLDLAGIAASGGFADQAHLTREFRAFTGSSPTRWLGEEGGLVL